MERQQQSYHDRRGRLNAFGPDARIASLLWRDDIDTARRYIDLYDRFNCSAEHLKLVFRCVIQQRPIDPKAADRLASRVHDCWISPDAPTTASQATIDTTTKAGTIPN